MRTANLFLDRAKLLYQNENYSFICNVIMESNTQAGWKAKPQTKTTCLLSLAVTFTCTLQLHALPRLAAFKCMFLLPTFTCKLPSFCILLLSLLFCTFLPYFSCLLLLHVPAFTCMMLLHAADRWLGRGLVRRCPAAQAPIGWRAGPP